MVVLSTMAILTRAILTKGGRLCERRLIPEARGLWYLYIAILTVLTMAIFGASASEASFQKLEGITKDIFSRSPGKR